MVDAFSKKNPAMLDDLLPLVYDDVPQGIHAVARRSLHAHLLKLRIEGRVVESAVGWRLT